MKPVMQQYSSAAGVIGDCYRASIASVLELDLLEVPHFGQDDPPDAEFQSRVDAFLSDRGLVQIVAPFRGDLVDVLATCAATNPGLYHLVIGRSPRGVNHVVVALDGSIAHDPSPHGGGLVGPAGDGAYWVIFFGARLAKAR